MLAQRIFIYSNVTLSIVLVLGLIVAGKLSVDNAQSVVVPKSYAWSALGGESIDAFSNDGAKLSSDALDVEEDAGPHPASIQARGLVALDHVTDAISLLELAIDREPQNPGLRNALGSTLLKADRNEDAVKSFDKAISLNNNEPKYHYNRATSLLRSSDFLNAILSFQDALALSPYHSPSRYNMALAHSGSGNTQDAKREYRQLIEEDRGATGASARFNLGVILMQEERLDEALEQFALLLRSQPSHADARFNRALILNRIGSKDEASEQYRRLLDVRPEHLRARLNLAALYMKDGDCDAASVQLDQLVARSPNYALAHYNLGVCSLRREQPKNAVPHLMKATSLAPKLGEAHYNLALAFSRLGDVKAALERYSAAVETSPEIPSYHYNYAIALSENGRLDDAITEYQAALRLDTEYFEARYNLGIVHYRNGDFDAAQHVFDKALKQRPDSYESAYNLGLALLKLNNESRAETILRRAVALEETTAAFYNLGLALARQDRHTEANTQYEAALRIDPKHARSIERLAEGNSELGNHDAALTRLEQLSRIQPDDPTALKSGIRLLRLNQFALAERYLEIATGNPGSVSARYNLGLAIAQQGRLEEAASSFAEVLILKPDHSRALERLAETSIALDDHDRAITALKRLVTLMPDDPTAINAGIRELTDDNYQIATRYFEASAAGSPRLRARSLDLLGRTLSRVDPEAALAHIRAAVTEFPNDEAIAERLRRIESIVARQAP